MFHVFADLSALECFMFHVSADLSALECFMFHVSAETSSVPWDLSFPLQPVCRRQRRGQTGACW